MSLDIWLTVTADTGGSEPHTFRLYDANITHNVGNMWRVAGCYESLYESDGLTAGEILPALVKARDVMASEPKVYRDMNPKNGWGNYEGALRWLEKLIDACRQHPRAIVNVSR